MPVRWCSTLFNNSIEELIQPQCWVPDLHVPELRALRCLFPISFVLLLPQFQLKSDRNISTLYLSRHSRNRSVRHPVRSREKPISLAVLKIQFIVRIFVTDRSGNTGRLVYLPIGILVSLPITQCFIDDAVEEFLLADLF